MKKAIFSFAILLFGFAAFSQSDNAQARELTDLMTEKFSLDKEQQAKMLTIQERNLRNLASIEDLKKSNPLLHIEKMRALKIGTDASIEMILNEDQRAITRQDKMTFRKKKSELYSSLKSQGASQQKIDLEIAKLEEASLLGKELD